MDFGSQLFHRFRSNGSDSGSASGSSKTPKKGAVVSEKRRDQLRKAQRAHRERSRSYQEALEQEIISLRAQDSRELQHCKTENALLRQLLLLNNIPIPELPQATGEDVTTRICIDTQHSSRTFIKIQRKTTPEQHDSSATTSPYSVPSSYYTDASGRKASTASVGRLHETDLVQIGVNFILFLEHPCMDHAHLLTGQHQSNNHAFLSSTALFSFASESPEQLVSSARKGRDSVWSSPDTQLDGLLSLCTQFVPEGEIAPVQMWHKVRDAVIAGRLPLQSVPAVQQALADHVECRGFGAAMEEHDFEQTLQQVAGSSDQF